MVSKMISSLFGICIFDIVVNIVIIVDIVGFVVVGVAIVVFIGKGKSR